MNMNHIYPMQLSSVDGLACVSGLGECTSSSQEHYTNLYTWKMKLLSLFPSSMFSMSGTMILPPSPPRSIWLSRLALSLRSSYTLWPSPSSPVRSIALAVASPPTGLVSSCVPLCFLHAAGNLPETTFDYLLTCSKPFTDFPFPLE